MDDATALRHGRPEEVGMDPVRIERIRAQARSWVEAGITPSLVVLVVRRGVIVLEEAYGAFGPDRHAPLTTDAIFPVMSVSKPVTAALVMCLVEDGLISLKHPVTDYLPEITSPGADQVLVADLLTHTSGWNDIEVYSYANRKFRHERVAPIDGQSPLLTALIRFGGEVPLATPPGVRISYCNFGYELLAEVIRRTSGKSFAQFARDRIFGPLGMKDSTFVLEAQKGSRRVTRPADFPVKAGPLLPSNAGDEFDAFDSGGTGLKSTAWDLAIFGEMLRSGGVCGRARVLSRAAVGAMTAPQTAPDLASHWGIVEAQSGQRIDVESTGSSFGYGLFIVGSDRMPYFNGSLMSHRTYGHEGFGSCNFWVDPDAELVGVYMSVIPRLLPGGYYLWRNHVFQDMVHAAIEA